METDCILHNEQNISSDTSLSELLIYPHLLDANALPVLLLLIIFTLYFCFEYAR